MGRLLSMTACLALIGSLCLSAVPATAELPRQNMALGATITADSSYNAPDSNVWHAQNLVDGFKMVDWPLPEADNTLGWCSAHYEPETYTTREVDITVQLKLQAMVSADEIILYPRGNEGYFFPEDYQLEVSEDGDDWVTIETVTGDTREGKYARSFPFSARDIQYVKLHITKLSDDLDWIYYCAAISEIEVWGRNAPRMILNKDELWMTPGAKDQLVPRMQPGEAGADYTYTYKETGAAPLLQVEPDGSIEALRCGETQVAVTERLTGQTKTCRIKVTETTRQDNILITVPVWDNEQAITREQFLWLREADIDGIMAVGHDNSQQATLDMLRIAKEIWDDSRERNLGVFIHSYNQGITPASSDEQILAYGAQYRHTPALMGYHIEDEPWYAQPYARVERLLKQADPLSITDINFRPGLVYGSFQEYQNMLADYAKLLGNAKSYLSFDNYPFTPAADSVDEYNLFGNFEAVRRAGRENAIPTAFYVQAIGSELYAYRRPDEGVLRYHMAAAMAYGFKWIKYFSWFVPGTTGSAEMDDFTDGIMDRDGNKTALYDVAAGLHKQIHNVGDVLVKLDAREVYHTGSKSTNRVYQQLPDTFFVQPEGGNQAIITLFVHPETGRQYLMLVNKDFTATQTMRFRLTGVSSLTELDKDSPDGQLTPSYADGVLERTFLPGEFALYALPQGCDYSSEPSSSDARNLLRNAYVTASDSVSTDGWYIDNVNDGVVVPTSLSKGWKTASAAASQWLLFDLGKPTSFDRLCLYPGGDNTGQASGAYLPRHLSLSVSNDGEQWTQVLDKTNIPQTDSSIAYSFTETSGRYIRLTMDDLTAENGNNICVLGEVQLFHDSAPTPTESTSKPTTESTSMPTTETAGKPTTVHSTSAIATSAPTSAPSGSITEPDASLQAGATTDAGTRSTNDTNDQESLPTGAASPVLPLLLIAGAVLAISATTLLRRKTDPAS